MKKWRALQRSAEKYRDEPKTTKNRGVSSVETGSLAFRACLSLNAWRIGLVTEASKERQAQDTK